VNGSIVHSSGNKSHLKLGIGGKGGCSGCPSDAAEPTCGFDGSNDGWFGVSFSIGVSIGIGIGIVGDSEIKEFEFST